MRAPRLLVLVPIFLLLPLLAQEPHNHPAPEKLGTVSFPISCAPSAQQPFNRAVALLHSFSYTEARTAFQQVAKLDPHCAMAHWGIAMSDFHQLWDPHLPADLAPVIAELNQAAELHPATRREEQFIGSARLLVKDPNTPYLVRANAYMTGMSVLAATSHSDTESQVFYALALLATASPTDRTHANQKKALAILQPLDHDYPDHPGITHYIIHATDSTELAQQGLPAARKYAAIAPSVPHALHMPSHIFTRLGLWQDSIASNIAARNAALAHNDTGEALHAMDYLVYAYLQTAQDREAAEVIHQLQSTSALNPGDPKIGYAATAMPIRYAVERGHWADAAAITPPTTAPPHVIAIAVWARGLGLARSGHPAEAREQAKRLTELTQQLRSANNTYWADQTAILTREVEAWSLQAEQKPSEAATLLRSAADDEDAIEKLPVTPGPILPAREQLGSLLLEQNHPRLALTEFTESLRNAPGRRGALQGATQAATLSAQRR